jgi:hypothetical protein
MKLKKHLKKCKKNLIERKKLKEKLKNLKKQRRQKKLK